MYLQMKNIHIHGSGIKLHHILLNGRLQEWEDSVINSYQQSTFPLRHLHRLFTAMIFQVIKLFFSHGKLTTNADKRWLKQRWSSTRIQKLGVEKWSTQSCSVSSHGLQYGSLENPPLSGDYSFMQSPANLNVEMKKLIVIEFKCFCK